jgi:hypothetical protein
MALEVEKIELGDLGDCAWWNVPCRVIEGAKTGFRIWTFGFGFIIGFLGTLTLVTLTKTSHEIPDITKELVGAKTAPLRLLGK